MNRKVRIHEVWVHGYSFAEVPGLYWHSGKFWLGNEEVRKVYNNGSLSLLLWGCTKKSIKKLRLCAAKCMIKIDEPCAAF